MVRILGKPLGPFVFPQLGPAKNRDLEGSIPLATDLKMIGCNDVIKVRWCIAAASIEPGDFCLHAIDVSSFFTEN